MTSERGQEFGFAPAHDAPIPYMQRIRDYYVALGYGAPYEWAHYARGAVPAAEEAAGAEPRVTIVTTAAPYQPDKGDQGPGAPYNAAAKFYKVYSGDTAKDHDLRISPCRHRPQAHHGRGPRHLVPAAGAAPRGRARAHRRGGAALPRAADQPQPPRDAGGRLPGGGRPLQGRRRRCGDPARQLPRLPPEHQPRRARAGGGRHRHRGDGLRQGHRRVRRRAAAAVLRLPARQCRRPAEGPAVAGLHAGACPEGAGDGARRAHHRAVAASLEQQSRLEARLPERRAHVARGDRAPPRRVRQAEAGRNRKLREDLGLQRDKAKASAA